MTFSGLVAAADITDFQPVTHEMLVNAESDANNWLMWRRTYNSWGYSPLDQINRDNVQGMTLAWARAMEPGPQETTPLVYNGIMYLVHPGDVVQALDATNGDLIWEYRRELPDIDVAWSIYTAKRGLALAEDLVFMATSDAALVALDAVTGEVVWEQQVADYRHHYRYTAAPLVVKDKLIAGMSGCTSTAPGGCFITAHELETGEELWRIETTAKPGQPGGDTWGDLPAEARYGGSAWITGSYDPDLNLVYWGVAQPIPWGRELRGTGDGATLYTNSTLAINPDTGEIVWYYQFNPGDPWDLDEHFEKILVDAEIDGEMRKLLLHVGKKGILFILDRETGEYIDAVETVYQNVVTLDRDTGRLIDVPENIPGIGRTVFQCPHLLGGKDWQAMAYNPETQTLFIPLNNACAEVQEDSIRVTQVGQSFGGLISVPRHAPGNNGNVGRVDAIRIPELTTVWKHEQRAPWTGALLATKGGLVFGGDENRRMKAFDADTGDVLWEVPLNTTVIGYPITYAVDGKQYVAVPVGSQTALSFLALTPEIAPPATGNALLVFALP